jgi:hypothetical protein
MMPRRLRDAATFRVRIQYREPTYEMRHGRKLEPYHWVYEIVAGSEAEAAASALREFHGTTRASSVGWVREVVGVHVTPALTLVQ